MSLFEWLGRAALGKPATCVHLAQACLASGTLLVLMV
jgi:hypothetical protein